MIVKARNDIVDFGRLRRVSKGKEYIVVAIEKTDSNEYFYILPRNSLKLDNKDDVNDPLWFESRQFEIIDNRRPEYWITKSIESKQPTTITSFPEWFENGFYCRAHDWDLHLDDYRILNRYLKLGC